MSRGSNFLLFFIAVIALSSCGTNDLKKYYGREGMYTMRPAFMGNMPQGDDSYSQGVRDGCNTAISVIGTGPMAANYDDNYVDINRSLEDNDYYRGKTIGYNYCTFYQDVDPL